MRNESNDTNRKIIKPQEKTVREEETKDILKKQVIVGSYRMSEAALNEKI